MPKDTCFEASRSLGISVAVVTSGLELVELSFPLVPLHMDRERVSCSEAERSVERDTDAVLRLGDLVDMTELGGVKVGVADDIPMPVVEVGIGAGRYIDTASPTAVFSASVDVVYQPFVLELVVACRSVLHVFRHADSAPWS